MVSDGQNAHKRLGYGDAREGVWYGGGHDDDVAGLALDRRGRIYVADAGNQCVRMVTPEGVVTTLAGKPGGADGFAGGGARLVPNSPKGWLWTARAWSPWRTHSTIASDASARRDR